MAKNDTTEPSEDVTEPEATEEAAAGSSAVAGTAEAVEETAPVRTPSKPAAAGAAGAEAARPNRRKVREGLVVSTAMDKTAVVAVTERVRHARYAKTVQRTRKLYVHDAENEANDGDRVRVAETRPLSKNKRWRLVEILERAR